MDDLSSMARNKSKKKTLALQEEHHDIGKNWGNKNQSEGQTLKMFQSSPQTAH